RLVINGLFYLTAYREDQQIELPEAVPAPLKARISAGPTEISDDDRRQMNKAGYIVIRRVGRAAIATPAHETPSSRGKVVSHWRRGHWKMQAHGQGRRDRRLIWVKPYQVNADNRPAEPRGRIHVVGPDGKSPGVTH
ncbi:MAG: hypothetical protein K2X45_17530, partial [Phreatobacter sp.]|nr:hypothetical protein [Phreatobacter sp.]